MNSILCSRCGEEKSADQFYATSGRRCKVCHCKDSVVRQRAKPERQKAARDRWRAKPGSREKGIEAAKRWSREHPHRVTASRFIRDLRKYGLTVEDFAWMLLTQNFCCAICLEKMECPHVDHNHRTGIVRGLLCDDCNRGIGLLKDNSAVLARAANYVSA